MDWDECLIILGILQADLDRNEPVAHVHQCHDNRLEVCRILILEHQLHAIPV